MSEAGFLFWVNVIIPILIAPIYFVMSYYVKKIKPLRLLIMGEKTYQYAFWAFFFFGLFLISRPLQILLGGDPAPLIISSIREFIMIGLFSPCIAVGVINQIFYDSDLPSGISRSIFFFCIILASIFVFFNIKAIGGAHLIFEYNFLGYNVKAYDGNWFLALNDQSKFVPFLFVIRSISPLLVLLLSSILALWKSVVFPKDSIYSNLPKKFYLEGFSLLIFSISILFTGIMAYFWNFQNQWYYLGA
ncbi:hypothetical protein ACFL5N_02900, partial [bacterium]